MKTGPRTVGVVLLLAFAAASGRELLAEEGTIRYRHDILPILSDRCFKCHGPDSATREAGLRLDQSDAAKTELESGVKAIVPGKPGESALVQRILSEDESEMMPPADSGKTLSDTEKELLRRWIAEGARYEKHWAFVAPTRPDVPDVEQPEFVANAIDRFVFARLNSEGVQPAPRASKERLIRRVYFDLIGCRPRQPKSMRFWLTILRQPTKRSWTSCFNHLITVSAWRSIGWMEHALPTRTATRTISREICRLGAIG
jgi:hypothetical protein